MLSTAADTLQLAQAAPWLAVAVLSLVAVGWVYRQSRRAVQAARDAADASAERQGKRIGELEKVAGLLDLRRRQVEWVLLDLGIELPIWPPDGPDQPRPRRRRDVDEDQDYEPDPMTAEQPPVRVPVPPLDLPGGPRHRRPVTL